MSAYTTLEKSLPEYRVFLQKTADSYRHGKFDGWQEFRAVCDDFYTDEMMIAIEQVVPRWRKMASYADRQTLIHVTAVLTSLLSLEEYLTATPEQQNLIEWIVLFHDIEKQAQPNKRDHTHGFRSAAYTAQALPRLGFQMKPHQPSLFDEWHTLTCQAEIYDSKIQDMKQDNRQLPRIFDGVEQLFECEAQLIIEGVLLHMSLSTIRQWPASAPLTDEEIKKYISPTLLPLLRAMILVDSDAWAFFEPDRTADEQRQTRVEFQRIEKLIEQ